VFLKQLTSSVIAGSQLDRVDGSVTVVARVQTDIMRQASRVSVVAQCSLFFLGVANFLRSLA
jgi:hypothetical protein